MLKRVKLRTRLIAFLIDSSILLGLSIILFWLFQLVSIYIGNINLFISIYFLYFLLFTIFLKSTPGKIICGLRVTYNGNRPYYASIILREVVYKTLLVFALPAYLLKVFQVKEYFNDLKGIFYFMFHEYTIHVFVLGASIVLLLLYLIGKQTWYDKLSGTEVEKQNFVDPKVKLFYISFILILCTVAGIKGTNYLLHGNVNNPIIPRQNKNKIAPYVSFLNKQKGAKEYIFELFEKYDIVILSERHHYEMTQYDFIYDLISDKRFIDNVGAVYTETGGSNYQVALDNLMNTNKLGEEEVEIQIANLLKNISISWPVWDKTNLFTHLKNLYKLNQTLAPEKRVNHYFTDIPFSWEYMADKQYRKDRRKLLQRRDEIMAENFSRQYKSSASIDLSQNKCLVIMNYRHGFGPVKNSTGELLEKNAAALIMEEYPEKSANVLINTVAFGFDTSKHGISVSSIQNGIWDNAFAAVGNKSLGFDFKNSPFGPNKFDMTMFNTWANYNYQDVFTGFIFYKPLEEHITSMGFPGILDNNFEHEMLERAKLIGNNASAEYNEKVSLLKENEIATNYVSYSELLPKKNSYLELIILSIGLVLSTWKYISNKKNLPAPVCAHL